jgi:hypothetical protein
MSPKGTIATVSTAELWEDNDFSDNELPSDEVKFSEVMDDSQVLNDDFLLMEDGLEIADDFAGLLDINTSSGFDSSAQGYFNEILKDQESLGKRSHQQTDSPPPEKKQRKSISDETYSPKSVVAIASASSLSSNPSLSIKELEDKYKHALQHLALSMRRSEMTRNEIIRQRREAEEKARLQAAAQVNTVAHAENFLTGNTATLTIGLDQSRRMLQSFMGQAKAQSF